MIQRNNKIRRQNYPSRIEVAKIQNLCGLLATYYSLFSKLFLFNHFMQRSWKNERPSELNFLFAHISLAVLNLFQLLPLLLCQSEGSRRTLWPCRRRRSWLMRLPSAQRRRKSGTLAKAYAPIKTRKDKKVRPYPLTSTSGAWRRRAVLNFSKKCFPPTNQFTLKALTLQTVGEWRKSLTTWRNCAST